MVARKGPINDWHFSHEGGQERPECPAGALNLLRRLAIQELERAPARIRDYLVAHPQPGCAPLRWTDRPMQPIRLVAGADSGSTEVARVALERSGEARIFVTIGRESPPLITSGAVLWVSVPLPEQVVIRSQADALAFVQAEMAVRWLHLPDLDGLLAAARVQAAQAMRERQEAAQRAQLLRRAEAGQRWAEIRRASAMADPPAAPTVDGRPHRLRRGMRLDLRWSGRRDWQDAVRCSFGKCTTVRSGSTIPLASTGASLQRPGFSKVGMSTSLPASPWSTVRGHCASLTIAASSPGSTATASRP
jgi:hypothetical protein